MQRWKVPVSFGSLQQNRCPGTNLNPVCRHGIAGHSREGALSETWPHISNFTLAEQSKLIMSISSCWLVETPSRTVMLVSCSTNPGRKYLSTFCRTFSARKGLCTHPRSPEPEPEGCCATAIWCSSSDSTKPLRFTINWNIPAFDLCSTITLYASIF